MSWTERDHAEELSAVSSADSAYRYCYKQLKPLLLSIPNIEELVKDYKNPYCTKRNFEVKLDWICENIADNICNYYEYNIDTWHNSREWEILKYKETEFTRLLHKIEQLDD